MVIRNRNDCIYLFSRVKLQQIDHQGDSLLIVSEKGMGKRTYLDEFTVQKRGGKGVKAGDESPAGREDQALSDGS